jgi:hypothetical protein
MQRSELKATYKPVQNYYAALRQFDDLVHLSPTHLKGVICGLTPFLVLVGDRCGWVPGEGHLRAAASETGFGSEDERASVTALEIDYGLLKKDPVQRRRCLLCLRAPLPYDRLPPDRAAIYSDERGTDPDAPERARRLKELKAKINHDPQLAPHRLPYRLDWDDQTQRPRNEGADGLAAPLLHDHGPRPRPLAALDASPHVTS